MQSAWSEQEAAQRKQIQKKSNKEIPAENNSRTNTN